MVNLICRVIRFEGIMGDQGVCEYRKSEFLVLPHWTYSFRNIEGKFTQIQI